jgi:arginase
MGRGAARLAADSELRAGIEKEGWSVTTAEIDAVDESDPEIVRVIELIRRLANQTKRAVADGAFPLVLAGNCNSALGTTAGIGADDLGVVWFDAHADFDDPDENESGFFDVMGLAMLTGRGWRALRSTIPGHVAIPEQNVILAAVRDLVGYQRRRLESSRLNTVPGTIDPNRFGNTIADLRQRVERIYLHVDLDSIDAGEASANEYAAPDGPGVAHLLDCIRTTCERFTVAGAAITAYDPGFDTDDRTLTAARAVARQIARCIRSRRTTSTPSQPTTATG